MKAVPSSEALRQAALSASWTRDHRIARRRLAFRWLLWAWWRIGLPLVLTLVLVAGLLWQLSPARVPTWLSPTLFSMGFPALSGNGTQPAATSPHSEQRLQGKEP
jgi:hypothetical protein